MKHCGDDNNSDEDVRLTVNYVNFWHEIPEIQTHNIFPNSLMIYSFLDIRDN